MCRFNPSELDAPKDYQFMFKYKIPSVNANSQTWPASFHMRREVPGIGFMKVRIKYKVEAYIKQIGT